MYNFIIKQKSCEVVGIQATFVLSLFYSQPVKSNGFLNVKMSGVDVPRVATNSNKKRKGSANGGIGEVTRSVKRGCGVNNVELDGTQEMAEAAVQPRRPL
jgi:hypothetical protein